MFGLSQIMFFGPFDNETANRSWVPSLRDWLTEAPQIVCSHRPGATLMITCYRVVILHRALMMSLGSVWIVWDGIR